MTFNDNKQVSEVLLEDCRLSNPSQKRARVIASGRSRGAIVEGDAASSSSASSVAPPKRQAANASVARPPVPETLASSPVSETQSCIAGTSILGDTAAAVARASSLSCRERPRAAVRALDNTCGARSASPTPSSASSSTFSAATTSAALSSRASLSSCRSFTSGRSSIRGSSRGEGGSSSRSHSRLALSSSSSSFREGRGFPRPSSWDDGDGGSRWRRDGGRRDRRPGCDQKERKREQQHCRRWSTKDYASEAGVQEGSSSRKHSGWKRSRSGSRERVVRRGKTAGGSGVKCERCLQWCRENRERRKPIGRTLPMDYWVRTQTCKAAKSKHIDYIDSVAFSREQFIEETVFTCPFTGAQRDIVLERNMFPYDVPTDVEHWTLWSRNDLSKSQMEAFVEKWASKNHPHAVEWECDNNEGDRSIDWFHVHVFFRLGCEDRTELPRDPLSVYSTPCRVEASSVSGRDESYEAEEAEDVTDSE